MARIDLCLAVQTMSDCASGHGTILAVGGYIMCSGVYVSKLHYLIIRCMYQVDLRAWQDFMLARI